MRKSVLTLFVLPAALCIATVALVSCASAVSDDKAPVPASCFDKVCAITAEKGGVKEITYEQFQSIRSSGEEYILLDVLPKGSYEKGHIEGAQSFPVETINYESAPARLQPTDKIIVYCGSFQCSASTNAAHRLQALGYKNVLDYKGGIKEWQEKGNALAQ